MRQQCRSARWRSGAMSDPDRQAAARAALTEASRELGMNPSDFAVIEVKRRRHPISKRPYYSVVLVPSVGTRLGYAVFDHGHCVIKQWHGSGSLVWPDRFANA